MSKSQRVNSQAGVLKTECSGGGGARGGGSFQISVPRQLQLGHAGPAYLSVPWSAMSWSAANGWCCCCCGEGGGRGRGGNISVVHASGNGFIRLHLLLYIFIGIYIYI